MRWKCLEGDSTTHTPTFSQGSQKGQMQVKGNLC